MQSPEHDDDGGQDQQYQDHWKDRGLQQKRLFNKELTIKDVKNSGRRLNGGIHDGAERWKCSSITHTLIRVCGEFYAASTAKAGQQASTQR